MNNSLLLNSKLKMFFPGFKYKETLFYKTEQRIDDFNCALADDKLYQGYMYVTSERILFTHSSIFFGNVQKEIHYSNMHSISMSKYLKIFDNSIEIKTLDSKSYFFTSYLSRNKCFKLLANLFKQYVDKENTLKRNASDGLSIDYKDKNIYKEFLENERSIEIILIRKNNQTDANTNDDDKFFSFMSDTSSDKIESNNPIKCSSDFQKTEINSNSNNEINESLNKRNMLDLIANKSSREIIERIRKKNKITIFSNIKSKESSLNKDIEVKYYKDQLNKLKEIDYLEYIKQNISDCLEDYDISAKIKELEEENIKEYEGKDFRFLDFDLNQEINYKGVDVSQLEEKKKVIYNEFICNLPAYILIPLLLSNKDYSDKHAYFKEKYNKPHKNMMISNIEDFHTDQLYDSNNDSYNKSVYISDFTKYIKEYFSCFNSNKKENKEEELDNSGNEEASYNLFLIKKNNIVDDDISYSISNNDNENKINQNGSIVKSNIKCKQDFSETKFKEKLNELILKSKEMTQINKNNKIVFHSKFVFPLEKRMFVPDKTSMKASVFVHVISPFYIIIDELNWSYDVTFADCFYCLNHYRIKTEVNFNIEKGIFEFDTYISNYLDIVFTKSCFLKGFISDKGLAEGISIIKEFSFPLLKDICERSQNKYISFYEDIQSKQYDNLCKDNKIN